MLKKSFSPRAFIVLLFVGLAATAALAQTTTFTYQGRLTSGGAPVADGTYNLQFRLFDTAAVGTGTQIATFSPPPVQVTNGAFTVPLDFGANPNAFPGAPRYLEIIVNGTQLNPRQQITSTPYAIRSLAATSADTAANSTQLGGVNASRFVQQDAGGNVSIAGGLTVAGTFSLDTVNAQTQYNLGGQRVLSVVSGSSGNPSLSLGTGAGNPNSSAFSTFLGQFAGAQNTGFANTFVGIHSGYANTTGSDNSFLGTSAGYTNTTGGNNSFFGLRAGGNNTTGSNNTIVGALAGSGNCGFPPCPTALTGNNNSFFGQNAGLSNTTGSVNSFFGAFSGSANTTGNRNSFFGESSGSANTTGYDNAFFGGEAGNANQTGFENSFFGTGAGLRNTTGGNNAFVGQNAGINNTTGGFNTFSGAAAGTSNTTGSSNAFFGYNAGFSNNASNNSFFGSSAGKSNTTGFNNSFFGYNAGQATKDTAFNSFFGFNAGVNNIGCCNTFLGDNTGASNTTGSLNIFTGGSAGFSNTVGSANTFYGDSAGQGNIAGSGNAFFGNASGQANTTGGNNTIIGFQANVGANNLTNATAIGANAVVSQNNSMILGSINGVGGATADTNVGIGTSSPQTRLQVKTGTGFYGFTHTDGAISVGSYVGGGSSGAFGGWLGTQSNHKLFFFTNNGQPTMTVDTTGNVGVGTITPASKLTVAGLIETTAGGVKFPDGTIQTTAGGGSASGAILNQTTQQVGANFNIDGTGKANILSASQFNFGPDRVLGSTTGLNSRGLLIGIGAGGLNNGGSGYEQTFVGSGAGFSNTTGDDNSFFGSLAGQNNTTGKQNTFVGAAAGGGNETGSNNSFYGFSSGINTNADNNSFFGQGSGGNNSTGTGNTFVGNAAGLLNTTGSNNTALGAGADFSPNSLTFATVIGANARVTSSNTIVIGRGAPTADTVQIPGNLVVSGTFTNPSDLRLKNSVANLRYGLREVLRLRPVTWTWKNDSAANARLGLIAQEVQPVMPELVVTGDDKDKMLSINYLGLLPVVVKAIQEQEATIVKLRREIAALKKQQNSNSADKNADTRPTTPNTNLNVTANRITVVPPGQGMILKSPDGTTCKMLSIDNAGAMVLTAVACP